MEQALLRSLLFCAVWIFVSPIAGAQQMKEGASSHPIVMLGASDSLRQRLMLELKPQGFRPIKWCEASLPPEPAFLKRLEAPCQAQAVLTLEGDKVLQVFLWRWQDGQVIVRQHEIPRPTRNAETDATTALQIAGWIRAQFVELDTQPVQPPKETPPTLIAKKEVRPLAPEPPTRGLVGLSLGLGGRFMGPGESFVASLGTRLDWESWWTPALILDMTLPGAQVEGEEGANASIWGASATLFADVPMWRSGRGSVCFTGLGAGGLWVRASGEAEGFETAQVETFQALGALRAGCDLAGGRRFLWHVSAAAAMSVNRVNVVFGEDTVATGAFPMLTMLLGVSWR